MHLLIWCVSCSGHQFKIDTGTAEDADIFRLICPLCRKTTDVHTCIGGQTAHCGCDRIQRTSRSRPKREASPSSDVASNCGRRNGSVVRYQ